MSDFRLKLAEMFFRLGEYILKTSRSDSKASLRIAELELTVRTTEKLHENEIFFVGQLLKLSEKDLFRFPGLGRKSVRELEDILSYHGLTLRKEETNV